MNRANDLRARIGETWASVDEGVQVDLVALGEQERLLEMLDRQMPRLQVAAQAEQGAEQVRLYHEAREAEMDQYTANSAAVMAAFTAADVAVKHLADVADQRARHIAHVLAIPKPTTLITADYVARSTELRVGDKQLWEVDPGDAVLSVAGAALASLPGRPWPQHAEEFRRIRAGLPPFLLQQ